MELVSKKGEIINTDWTTVDHTEFIDNIIKKFSIVMVGVCGGKQPFEYIYFKVSKADITDTVRMGQMKVTYSIMYNSKVNSKMKDILYINKLRMTLLDKIK